MEGNRLKKVRKNNNSQCGKSLRQFAIEESASDDRVGFEDPHVYREHSFIETSRFRETLGQWLHHLGQTEGRLSIQLLDRGG
eukprot:scaffold2727_cov275-Chaetoceros_neogracile.AAC.47